MQKRFSIWHTKMTAAFLLLNLLFANIVQTAHTHNDSSSKTSGHHRPGGEQTLHHEFSCFFCEHPFIREYEYTPVYAGIEPCPTFPSTFFTRFYSDPIPAIVLLHDSRGPPNSFVG